MRLALVEPDIPQNAGALIRLGACMGVPVDLVDPLGFLFDDARFRRAHLDYVSHAQVRRHAHWRAFCTTVAPGARLVAVETGGEPLPGFAFRAGDVLLLGRESAGLPPAAAADAAARVSIPMQPGLRSLNVAIAGAMALGEALRQTGAFPGHERPSPHERPSS